MYRYVFQRLSANFSNQQQGVDTKNNTERQQTENYTTEQIAMKSGA